MAWCMRMALHGTCESEWYAVPKGKSHVMASPRT